MRIFMRNTHLPEEERNEHALENKRKKPSFLSAVLLNTKNGQNSAFIRQEQNQAARGLRYYIFYRLTSVAR